MVLPFANIGGVREQEYFVDGITESLTTDLSQIPDSFVIARNTAFTYKDKPVDVKQIGRELGIAYVVEGSVQRAAKKIRVNVQLIDTSTGSHLWAERFDRDHSELFQMQDEIIARLARTLDIELVAAVVQSEAKFHSENPSSVDYTFRGRAAMNRGLTFEFQNEASRNFEQAIAIDPNNAAAWAGLAFAQGNIVGNFMTDDRAAHLRTAENAALRALKLAPNNPRGHAALGNVYRSSNRPIEAIGEFELALELDPNLLQAYPLLGIAKIGAGRAEETEGHITDAIRISPKDRSMHGFCLVAGAGNLFATRDEEAVLWLLRSIKANQEYPLPHFYLAIAFALQNKLLEARDEIRAGLALDPCFSLRRYQGSAYSDNPRYLIQRERLLEGLRNAGLPE
jgi:TolB-like protein